LHPFAGSSYIFLAKKWQNLTYFDVMFTNLLPNFALFWFLTLNTKNMKHRLLLAFVTLAFVFAGCNGDEIDDLTKRVNQLEKITGSNEPMIIDFATQDDADEDVIKNTSYFFKAAGWYTQYMGDRGDGTYEVYVERLGDLDWDEDAWFYFVYDPETGDVTEQSCGIYFYSYDRRTINASFRLTNVENTVDVTVKSFNVATGKIDVTVNGATTTNSDNNTYTGNAMTMKLSFKGTLQPFIGGGD
jgi:hypothetical protein